MIWESDRAGYRSHGSWGGSGYLHHVLRLGRIRPFQNEKEELVLLEESEKKDKEKSEEKKKADNKKIKERLQEKDDKKK